MMPNQLLFTCIVFGFLSGCQPVNRSQQIVNSWKVTDIRMASPDTIHSSSQDQDKGILSSGEIIYHFKADGSYAIRHAGQQDEGSWIISNDQKALILTSHHNKADNAEFVIESFSAQKLMISSDASGVREIITLEPTD